MDNLYRCKYCKKVFEADEYDACYECENGHITELATFDVEPELIKRYQYKPGQQAPAKILIASRKWEYDEEQQKSFERFTFHAYKYVGEVSPTESEEILKERADRKAEEEAYWERRRAEWEAEAEAKKAKEAAEQADTEQTA